jgi:hypothetical protein
MYHGRFLTEKVSVGGTALFFSLLQEGYAAEED